MIPSLLSFYEQLVEATIITDSIIKSVALFPLLDNTLYFENYLNQSLPLAKETIFFDNIYWDKFRTHRYYVINNHFH